MSRTAHQEIVDRHNRLQGWALASLFSAGLLDIGYFVVFVLL